MLSADEKLGFIFIAVVFIAVPLSCWLLCLWVDYQADDVGRRCRRKNREYFEWEQRQKRKRRK
jgi:hypothetical protein